MLMENNFKTIIFDFDYTLADSSRGICECVCYALRNLELPEVPAETICRTIGLTLPETFITLCGEQHRDKTEEFLRYFKTRSDEVMNDRTILFECVPAALSILKTKGIKLGIVSTKYRYRIEGVLRREGIYELFDLIVGGEDVANHKPDPEGLLTAIGKLGNTHSSCLYIGDSVTDAETARRAGVRFAAVLSGATGRGSFSEYQVVKFFDTLEELPEFIEV